MESRRVAWDEKIVFSKNGVIEFIE
jgi:hypothetical protein